MKARIALLIACALLPLSCADAFRGMSVLRANRLMEADRIHEAVALYLEAGVDSYRGAVAYDLANAFARMGEFDSAEPLFLAAGQTGSPRAAASAWYNLGVARLERGQAAEAAQAFRSSIEALPGNPDAVMAYERALAAIPESDGGGAAERGSIRGGEGGTRPEAYNLARRNDTEFYTKGAAEGQRAEDH